MSDEVVSLKIDQSLVQKTLEKKIQAEVLASIGDPAKIVSEVVAHALRIKVNADGKHENYDSYNKYDLIEWLSQKAIQKHAMVAVQEVIDSHGSLIKEAIIKEMKRPQRIKSLAEVLANHVEESLKHSWHLTCNFQVQPDKDE